MVEFLDENCLHCGEPLERDNLFTLQGERKFIHRECLIRSVAGSVAHQQQKCLCFGGRGEDDPNLSRRENARRSANYFSITHDRAAKAKFN